MRIAFYDTKPYDRDYFGRAAGADRLEWHFHEFRLSTETAGTAQGAQAVCVFVNDRLDRACLDALADNGRSSVALGAASWPATRYRSSTGHRRMVSRTSPRTSCWHRAM